ncbi:MAG: hypothetical protein L6R40_007169 [Gallowayella cf. fulva]|nr:MAG: hypothetical protein L6R40_007169 [Xanthomendoza cf. fulva]
MADYQNIAQQFTQFYYRAFDENRESLAALYRDQSMLTFESSSVQGTSGIVQKLVVRNTFSLHTLQNTGPNILADGSSTRHQDLPFQKVQHQISTLDAQPSGAEGGIMVMVTGALKVDDEERPMNYCQVFQLLPDGAGSYFVFNDMFKLIYG